MIISLSVRLRTLIFLFFSITGLTLSAQFRGTNILEFQYGKLPTEVNDVFPSVYDRATFSYRYKKFTASTTLENYYTQFGERNFTDLSQVALRFNNKHWDLKVGNIYETLGRGTLLRAFEVKGAILEDIGLRTRNYFHRDILGASAKYKSKKFSVQLMHGDVLNNLIPPTKPISERRTDKYTSLSIDYKYYKKHKIELIGFNHNKDGDEQDNFFSGSLTGPLPLDISYYVEYTQDIGDQERRSFIGGLNGLFGDISYSLEYKNYKNMILGGGINEPAQMVKDQTYRMLNRSTHVSNPTNEDGYQIDVYYSFKGGAVLNLNHSLSRNNFGSFNPLFQQYYLELSSSYSSTADFKLYLDYSKDGLKGEPNRYSMGLYNDIKLSEKLRFLPEFELQQIERFDEKFVNQFYSLGFGYNSKLNFNFEIEITGDPFLIEENSTKRIYPGMNLRYKLNRDHTVQMFAGQRRGGPACSAGVCYEILDFRGFEFRISSRF